MSKCSVCGKETNTTVCCSTCGAISFAYCNECLRAGREPYDALVGMGLYYADINNTYKQQILDPSLKFHGKTREQFNNDVLALDKELSEWFAARENKTDNVEECADDFEM